MEWLNNVTVNFQKRVGRYLINKYLDNYLENGAVLLEQLEVKDDIHLRDVALNIHAINHLLEDSELPLEFVDGYIGELSVTIPWSTLLQDNCFFSIDGLTVTVQVKKREHPAQISTSIFHSMCESFSSKDMAEECFKQTEKDPKVEENKDAMLGDGSSVKGIEFLAQAIDSIIEKVKVTFKNTTFRIEYVPTKQTRGLAIELKVGKIMYAGDPEQNNATNHAYVDERNKKKQSSTVKRLFFEDVSLYSDDFEFKHTLSMIRSASEASSRNDELEEEELNEEEKPLQMAAITGRQELVIRFKDTNQLGLPRKIEEINLNLGMLCLHLYPHQLHCLIEIISALSVPSADSNPWTTSEKKQEKVHKRLENLLQQSMVFNPISLDKGGWNATDSLSSSSEFNSSFCKQSEFEKPLGDGTSKDVPVPMIVFKLSHVAGAFIEKDENIAKMGGQRSKTDAIQKMQSAAYNFFQGEFEINKKDPQQLKTIQKLIKKYCKQSHVALAGATINVTYLEEGADVNLLDPDYAMMTSVKIGLASLKENIFGDPLSDTPTEVIPLLEFHKRPDNLKLGNDLVITYKELLAKTDDGGDNTSLEFALNPCVLNFEPGLVDRTFLIFNYAEMDPACLVTPLNSAESHKSTTLNIFFRCPDLSLHFQVPKADLRKPKEIPKFMDTFWSRKTHPEIFILSLRDMDVFIKTVVGNLKEPVIVRAVSNAIEVSFQENEYSTVMSLIQIRRSAANSSAASISVAVHLDEANKLRGKYSSEKRCGSGASSYYVSKGGQVTGEENTSSNIFLQQVPFIEEALEHGRYHHNLLIDMKFDDVSLLIPSKHVYEVIYNRLGNDLLLWVPEIYRVKEFLYDQPLLDPLQDPDMGFSTCFSSNKPGLQWQGEDEMDEKVYSSFPRDQTSVLNIHTDTCVVLAIKKAQVSVTTLASPIDPTSKNQVLMGILDQFKLVAVVGLEKEPEITLFSLALADAVIKFGTFDCILPSLHFDVDPPGSNLETLVTRTKFKDRAWAQSVKSPHLLKLTSKILFDMQANLKSINLAFDIADIGIQLNSVSSPPAWADWLQDFFTVVEYPVTGYIPPAILTEMQFSLDQCSAHVTPESYPVTLSLCLGHAKVTCNLMDTGKDLHIAVNLKNLAFFMAKDSVDPIKQSVCICDIDAFDLDVRLKEDEATLAFLDVCLSCDRLRARTCADTLQIIAEFAQTLQLEQEAKALSSDSTPSDSERNSRDVSEEPILVTSETIIPDIAEAMAELQAQDQAALEAEKARSAREQGQMGTHVFCFPNENRQLDLFADDVGLDGRPPVSMGFSEDPNYDPRFESDESFEEFCILEDEVGSGITPKCGEPTSRPLDLDVLIVKDNQYKVPDKKLDYLKPPKGFPNFRSRIMVSKLSAEWQIIGGHDFMDTKQRNSQSALAIVSPSQNSKSKSEMQEELLTRGGPGRNKDNLLEICLNGVQFTHEEYPDHCAEVSRQVLVIPSYEIVDKVKMSHINKFLHLYASRTRPRQSNANMFQVRRLNSKPAPNERVEACVEVKMMPIRFNIDQDTLFFLIDFFNTLKPKDDEQPFSATQPGQAVTYNRGMETIEVCADEIAVEAKEESVPNSPRLDENRPVKRRSRRKQQKKSDVYIRSFIFSTEVPIRIDYSAKYFDIRQGAVAGMLAGLTSLNCSELTLKPIYCTKGILGFEKLLTLLVTEWMTDIRNNQIPRLLGGVGPMYSVLQLFQGIKDLFLLPLEQYQKDGRLLRGLQKGAHSFSASTTMSLLDLTNKLLGVIQFAAEMAFDVMSPEGCVVQGKLPHPVVQRRNIGRLAKPADFREGVLNAMTVVREGFEETTRALTEAASREHSRRGMGGAACDVMAQIPSTIVRPVIVGAAAVTNVFEGVQGTVAPDVRKEEEEKWRNTSHN